eukprot:CAMPEP_0171121310 /NCGR_PEP_ID=MMETSP0766_2-20121228/102115_1 /TAXON_ID=439317 /ORGANISM="Gambierdiscus australes, Strain CAWD 149" /LENGTH=159 /DNA_ID=CAMNT_0011584087 /DNA_START=249 /DNA_END=725 /DNA_ORIENTATION=-
MILHLRPRTPHYLLWSMLPSCGEPGSQGCGGAPTAAWLPMTWTAPALQAGSVGEGHSVNALPPASFELFHLPLLLLRNLRAAASTKRRLPRRVRAPPFLADSQAASPRCLRLPLGTVHCRAAVSTLLLRQGHPRVEASALPAWLSKNNELDVAAAAAAA